MITRLPMLYGGLAERALDAPAFFAGRYRGGLQHDGTGAPTAAQLLRANAGWPAIAERPIAQRLSSLELELVRSRRLKKGTMEDEVIDSHPLLDALHANPVFSLRQQLMLLGYWLSRGGDAYFLKVTDGLRLTRELWPLSPDRMQMITDPDEVIAGWAFQSDGGEYLYGVDEIVRVWSPNPANMFAGMGALGSQALSYDTDLFIKQTERSFYESDATPKVLLTGQANSRAPEAEIMKRWEKDWRQKYHSRTGTSRGIPGMVPPGFDVTQLDAFGGVEEQAALIQELRDRIMMSYGVPRSIVGDVVDANRAAAETNQFVFDQHTVLPLTLLIEEAFTRGLARDYDADLKLRFRKFVATDKDYDLRREQQDLTTKVRSINTVLSDRGDDPVKWGDEPIGTMSDYPYDPEEARESKLEADSDAALADDDDDEDLPAKKGAAAAEEEDNEAEEPRSRTYRERRKAVGWQRVIQSERRHAPAFERALREVLARQRDEVLGELSQRAAPVKGELLPDAVWQGLFNRKTAPVRRRAFAESAEDALKDAGGKGFRLTQQVVKSLERDGATMVARVNATTRRRLRTALTEGATAGESVNTIAGRVREIFRARRDQARTIARTEVHRATQRGQLEGFAQSEVVGAKQWNTSQDDAVRDSHQIDGQQQRLGDPFELDDGELADSPGEGTGGEPLSARNAINCRCFVTPVFEGE